MTSRDCDDMMKESDKGLKWLGRLERTSAHTHDCLDEYQSGFGFITCKLLALRWAAQDV